MLYEKKKLLVRRWVWFALLVITFILSIKYWTDWSYESFSLWLMYLFIYMDVAVPGLFICSLLLSCNIYEYDGKEILVYAGWYHHYVTVDGRKSDEHNTIVYHTPIHLSCTLDDGAALEATISLTTRVSLKINNQLYTKKK